MMFQSQPDNVSCLVTAVANALDLDIAKFYPYFFDLAHIKCFPLEVGGRAFRGITGHDIVYKMALLDVATMFIPNVQTIESIHGITADFDCKIDEVRPLMDRMPSVVCVDYHAYTYYNGRLFDPKTRQIIEFTQFDYVLLFQIGLDGQANLAKFY